MRASAQDLLAASGWPQDYMDNDVIGYDVTAFTQRGRYKAFLLGGGNGSGRGNGKGMYAWTRAESGSISYNIQ